MRLNIRQLRPFWHVLVEIMAGEWMFEWWGERGLDRTTFVYPGSLLRGCDHY